MKKTIKISIPILICTLIISTMPALAVQQENTYKNNYKQDILRSVNLAGYSIEYVPLNEYHYKKTISKEPIFTASEEKNGTQYFTFYEKGLENCLEIKSSGELYLDGYPITISSYDDNGKLLYKGTLNINKPTIEPMAHRTTKFQKLPAGVKDSQLDYQLPGSKNSVSIGEQVWKNVGINVIITILCTSFVGLWGGVASVVAEMLIDTAKAKTPYSNYLSMIKKERRGMHLAGYTVIKRTDIAYYGTRDYKSYLGSSTYYTGFTS